MGFIFSLRDFYYLTIAPYFAATFASRFFELLYGWFCS